MFVAEDRGGIANGLPIGLTGGPVTLNNSQVTGNTAGHGGGIFNHNGTVTLAKRPVTGNTPDNCEPSGTIPRLHRLTAHRRQLLKMGRPG